MTADRELLEMAAKAAGMSVTWHCEAGCFMRADRLGTVPWSPLQDDGDALRLAVKLNMGISIPVHRTIRADVVCFRDSSVTAREEGDDPYAATRRAIVRAAADIGRKMK